MPLRSKPESFLAKKKKKNYLEKLLNYILARNFLIISLSPERRSLITWKATFIFFLMETIHYLEKRSWSRRAIHVYPHTHTYIYIITVKLLMMKYAADFASEVGPFSLWVYLYMFGQEFKLRNLLWIKLMEPKPSFANLKGFIIYWYRLCRYYKVELNHY